MDFVWSIHINRGEGLIDLILETRNSAMTIYKDRNGSDVPFAHFDNSNDEFIKNRKGGKRKSGQGRHDWVGA